MNNPLANDLTWAAQCIRPEVIEVGSHREMTLLDAMAEGSTVALLMFDIAMVGICKRRNAAAITVIRAEQDAADRAKQVRAKVFSRAFQQLKKWR